jgi:hypothetical protein
VIEVKIYSYTYKTHITWVFDPSTPLYSIAEVVGAFRIIHTRRINQEEIDEREKTLERTRAWLIPDDYDYFI